MVKQAIFFNVTNIYNYQIQFFSLTDSFVDDGDLEEKSKRNK